MDTDSSTKFISSLTKFLQSLCNGYVEFEDGVELIGHIYLSVDSARKSKKKIDYILNEKVCKVDNAVTFVSNSFHALPEGKSKPAKEDKRDDGNISDSNDAPRSTNAGTVPSRLSQGRQGHLAGQKRPGSPVRGPPSQRRAPTPPSQRRPGPASSKVPSGSPASRTVPSSPSSSSQDNIPSPAARKRSETSQPPSNQSDNPGADNDNDIPAINPTADFANFIGSLTGDNQSSKDNRSPPERKPFMGGDPDISFIKEEFVSEPSSCAQSGSGGQQSGGAGEDDGSGLYPVMLHQNTSVFPSTSSGYPPPSYGPGGASATATSQPSFPGASTSQSDLFNVPGSSQDGSDPSGGCQFLHVDCTPSGGVASLDKKANQEVKVGGISLNVVNDKGIDLQQTWLSLKICWG